MVVDGGFEEVGVCFEPGWLEWLDGVGGEEVGLNVPFADV